MNNSSTLKNYNRGILGRISNFFGGSFRKIDRFGYPISLTYKNEVTFKSSFGGVMTFLAVVSLLVYFFLMLQTAINHQKYNLINSRFVKDLYVDQSDYTFLTS